MHLLKTSRSNPWPWRLKKVSPGKPINVHLGSASACRQAISRSLPDSGCNYEFETKKKSVKVGKKVVKYLEVVRIA